MTRILISVAAAAMLVGCASSGPLGTEVLTGSLKPETARVVIYRASALGFAIQPSYVIDGQSTVASQPNGFLVCDLRPGRHEIAVANTSLNVNLFGGSDKASVDLRPGTTTFFRAEPQLGFTVGIITLSNVTEQQGRADTASLHRLEASCGA